MLIINQDRSKVITMVSSSIFYVVPVIHEGIGIGYNILLNWDLLGTFYDRSEALHEMGLILSSTSKIYLVNTYKNY